MARSETASDFLRFCRCPALVDGSYLLFQPGKSAVLRTLLDKRYFKPPRCIDEMTAMAAADNDDRYPVWKRLIRRECRSFFERYQVADFDILVTYYYWADS